MNREFKDWFVTERAKALAVVLLTRRDDLAVKETQEENGLDYTVRIMTGHNGGDRPFGVYMGASMASVTLEEANKQLKPVMGKVQSIGPFHFPVCVFYFTVKDDQGYYAWAYEPLVTAEGQLRLTAHAEAHCNKLRNESLEDIISAVMRWYDIFYATITSSGDVEQAETAVNPQFAALADTFDARVRAANISGTTEVTLVYRCVDKEGRDLPPVRTSIVPQTQVAGFGTAGPAFAASIHRDTILGNIDSLVRHAPSGVIMLRDAPRIPLRIVGFDLEIEDVDTSAEGRKQRRVRQEKGRKGASVLKEK
ncbi:MAG TPA: hypothetical protein VEL76_04435 [Gemmataceae bacterium]|nr:hypothetical protein [Gemmataceae bacterium]